MNYETERKNFADGLENLMKNEILAEDFKSLYNSALGSDADKKMALDQALRDKLFDLTLEDAETSKFITLLNLTASIIQMDLCTAGTLFVMLSDMFDTLTLDRCDVLFDYVEQHIAMWKLDVFYNAGKNYMLRVSNDLLRRLSKSQNTVFCGRIQLFLARLFPLEEKSGLNLTSQFNVENVTTYANKELLGSEVSESEEKEKVMDVEEGEMAEVSQSVPVDYNLYRKFWALQDFFRKPTQCYDKTAWKTFTAYTEEVLNCFSSYKLDDYNSSSPLTDGATISSKQIDVGDATTAAKASSAYFAKYLTSEKLLDLQLSDSGFRRSVLVQHLITFQYLTSTVKFKATGQMLTDEQAQWVKDTQDKVKVILRETPPNGDKFTETIEHMLSREENWSGWKNDGCASFIRHPPSRGGRTPAGATVRAGRKRSMGEQLRSAAAIGQPQIKMGSAELTRLWNLAQDNMAACRDNKRKFLPSVEEYFEEAIEQSDPSGGIEEQYKLVNNGAFAWKSLRLLARKSSLFFAQQPSGNVSQQPKPLPKYLEGVLNRIAKSMGTDAKATQQSLDEMEATSPAGAEENLMTSADNGNTVEELKQDVLETEDQGSANNDDDAEERNGNVGVASDQSLASDGLLERLADLLAEADWLKFATIVNFTDDDISAWRSSSSTVPQAALKMLKDWKEINAEEATVSELRTTLYECELGYLVPQLFSLPATPASPQQ